MISTPCKICNSKFPSDDSDFNGGEVCVECKVMMIKSSITISDGSIGEELMIEVPNSNDKLGRVDGFNESLFIFIQDKKNKLRIIK